MPCILCHRRIAALPLPICSECKEARAECGERPPVGPRIDRRPPYRPAPRTEQPETD